MYLYIPHGNARPQHFNSGLKRICPKWDQKYKIAMTYENLIHIAAAARQEFSFHSGGVLGCFIKLDRLMIISRKPKHIQLYIFITIIYIYTD